MSLFFEDRIEEEDKNNQKNHSLSEHVKQLININNDNDALLSLSSRVSIG